MFRQVVNHHRARTHAPQFPDSESEVLRDEQQASRGSVGAVTSPSGFEAEAQLSKVFPLFSALRMVTPDAIKIAYTYVDLVQFFGGGTGHIGELPQEMFR